MPTVSRIEKLPLSLERMIRVCFLYPFEGNLNAAIRGGVGRRVAFLIKFCQGLQQITIASGTLAMKVVRKDLV